jgi:hypothetical protein
MTNFDSTHRKELSKVGFEIRCADRGGPLIRRDETLPNRKRQLVHTLMQLSSDLRFQVGCLDEGPLVVNLVSES